MEIRDYCIGDEKAIIELFQRSFGKPMSKEYWYWRFRDNPAGRHYIKLMWNESELVGHYAVSPFMFNNQGNIARAALSMTTMTHPNYAGKGIFKILADALYNSIAEEHDVKFVVGFPNNNSHYGFLKNLDWKDLAVVHHLVLDAKAIKPRVSPYIKEKSVFSQDHVNLLDEINTQKLYTLDRSLEYLRWRYEHHPKIKHYIFDFYANELCGFLVVKLYPMQDGTFGVFIMENGVPLDRTTLLPEILSHILEYFKEYDIAVFSIWVPLFDMRHIYFEKYNFMLGGKATFYGIRPLDQTLKGVMNIQNWYYSYGDSDVY